MGRTAYGTPPVAPIRCDRMGTVREALDAYIASRRWARTTLRLNRYTLDHFAAAVGDGPVAALRTEHVQAWWATQAHVCASTARTRRSTIAGFIRWCQHCDLLDGDPMAGIPVPKEPRRVPVTLQPDEVHALLRVLPDDRAHCVAMLMLGIGLRCIDVHRLEVADVDLQRRLVTVHGKGGHTDVLPLPSEVAAAIARYLRRHPCPAGPLVRTYDLPVRALSAQRLSDLFSGWLRDAGVKQRRHDGRGAHALRRTCATGLLDDGANLRQVQAVMRHESLQTTQRYLRQADAEELRPVLERPICV